MECMYLRAVRVPDGFSRMEARKRFEFCRSITLPDFTIRVEDFTVWFVRLPAFVVLGAGEKVLSSLENLAPRAEFKQIVLYLV